MYQKRPPTVYCLELHLLWPNLFMNLCKNYYQFEGRHAVQETDNHLNYPKRYLLKLKENIRLNWNLAS